MAELAITLYKRPNGAQEEIICRFISEDDANWFKTRSVKVSMESDGRDNHILYADYGGVDEEGEPEEIVVFSAGRDCEPCMKELRERTERAMLKPRGI